MGAVSPPVSDYAAAVKALQQLLLRGRAAGRRLAAEVGRPRRPAALVLRLDGTDADPGGPPGPSRLSVEDWQDHIAAVVQEAGPLPVRVIAAPTHPWLAETARFAWRLECPVTVRTTPEGLDEGVARSWVDAGVRRVILLDEGGEGTVGALAALRAGAGHRSGVFDVLVECGPAAGALAERGARLREAGADGVRARVPWQGRGDEAWIDGARGWIASANRSGAESLAVWREMDGAGPGAPRDAGHCPVAGLRLELRPDGAACHCPMLAGAVAMGPELGPVLAALGPQREAIHACARRCAHAEIIGR